MTMDSYMLTLGVIEDQSEAFDTNGDMVAVERRTALMAIGSLLVCACTTSKTGLSSPTAAANAQLNKANYLAAKAAYNARDLDGCLAYYASNHQIMSKPTPPGRQHIRGFFESTFAASPDVQIIVELALAEDDWVLARSHSIATHTKPLMGIPATGKRIEAGFWDLHRFDDRGLIVQTWNLTDSLAVMRQIGILS
jgi:predicted ester cyclase